MILSIIGILLSITAIGLFIWLRKELPSIIGKVVGQIEFAQDKLNRKM